jgi:hypothetical protein
MILGFAPPFQTSPRAVSRLRGDVNGESCLGQFVVKALSYYVQWTLLRKYDVILLPYGSAEIGEVCVLN